MKKDLGIMQYSRGQYFQSMKKHPISILLAVVLSF